MTLLGSSLALFAVAAILILLALDLVTAGSNPYLGIFTFLVLPGLLVVGLVLIPVGMAWERRRLLRGSTRPLVVDLGDPEHRRALVTFLVGTSIFLLITTVGMYGGFEYSESVEFCGKVCHAVMEPEYTAHANGSHAKVACVRCHIGPGAGWFVKSKISGARQVFKTLAHSYPTPIPTPIENLRPAQEVCEQCHWPEHFYGSSMVRRIHYLGDEENTPWEIDLLLHIGGSGTEHTGHPSGIHWHIDPANHMTYVAEDFSRNDIR